MSQQYIAHHDVCTTWQRFFSLLSVPVDSRKRLRYSSHMNSIIQYRLSESLNENTSLTKGGVSIGVWFLCKETEHELNIGNCEVCGSVSTTLTGCRNGHLPFLRKNLSCDLYRQITIACEMSSVPIAHRDYFDSVNGSIDIPEYPVQKSNGKYVYVMSKGTDVDRCFLVSAECTIALVPDVDIHMILQVDNSSDIIKRYNRDLNTQMGWCKGVSLPDIYKICQ